MSSVCRCLSLRLRVSALNLPMPATLDIPALGTPVPIGQINRELK